MNFAFDYQPGARVTFYILLQGFNRVNRPTSNECMNAINYSRLGAYYIFS